MVIVEIEEGVPSCDSFFGVRGMSCMDNEAIYGLKPLSPLLVALCSVLSVVDKGIRLLLE